MEIKPMRRKWNVGRSFHSLIINENVTKRKRKSCFYYNIIWVLSRVSFPFSSCFVLNEWNTNPNSKKKDKGIKRKQHEWQGEEMVQIVYSLVNSWVTNERSEVERNVSGQPLYSAVIKWWVEFSLPFSKRTKG